MNEELKKLAEEYHEECDRYDAIYCTGISPRSGEPVPANSDEYIKININARKIRDELAQKAEGMGFTKQQLMRAISEVGNQR